MERIQSIQYLRAVAAFVVTVFHYLENTPTPMAVGAAGVDIFFVISGFIMASLTFGREASPGVFLWRRAIRIVPLYWLATLAAVAILAVKPGFYYRGDNSFGNTLLSLLFVPHVSEAGGAPVLGPGWTLEYEVFFYALCGIALLLPSKHRMKTLCAMLGALAFMGFTHPDLSMPWNVYTNQLLLEFALGIALAAAWRSNLMPGPAVGLVALLAGIGAFVLLQVGVIHHSGQRLIDWGMPAFLVVAGALSLDRAGVIGTSRIGILLGNASYSLYLTHILTIAAAIWIGAKFELDGWVIATGAIGGSVIVALASYLLVEKPLTAWLKSLPFGEKRKPADDPHQDLPPVAVR